MYTQTTKTGNTTMYSCRPSQKCIFLLKYISNRFTETVEYDSAFS